MEHYDDDDRETVVSQSISHYAPSTGRPPSYIGGISYSDDERTMQHVNDGLSILHYHQDPKNHVWERKYISAELRSGAWDMIATPIEGLPNAWTFPVFTPAACAELVHHLSGKNTSIEGGGDPTWVTSTDAWSNSNGNRGYKQTEKKLYPRGAFHTVYTSILRNYIHPLLCTVTGGWKKDAKGLAHDTHFVRIGGEGTYDHTKPHFDESTYTVTVCLNEEGVDYSGGTFVFSGSTQQVFAVPKGHAVLHLGGPAHKHGVRPVTKGRKFDMTSLVRFKRITNDDME